MDTESSYTLRNAFEESYFPEDWDNEDFEFLANFLEEEYDDKFVRGMNPDDWDYVIFNKA